MKLKFQFLLHLPHIKYLVATLLDCVDIRYLHQCKKFCLIVLPQSLCSGLCLPQLSLLSYLLKACLFFKIYIMCHLMQEAFTASPVHSQFLCQILPLFWHLALLLALYYGKIQVYILVFSSGLHTFQISPSKYFLNASTSF